MIDFSTWKGTSIVLQVPYNREKEVCKSLSIKNITHYCPIVKSLFHFKSHDEWCDAPLFSGYVFCNLLSNQYLTLYQGRNRTKTIYVKDRNFISDLTNIQSKLIMDPKMIKEESWIGCTIRISEGNVLQGIQGKVVSQKGNKVDIESNGKVIQIDSKCLERA